MFCSRTCQNGKFINDIDQECLASNGYTCTISDNDAFDNSACQKEGFKCVITKESQDNELYPHLGVCKKIEKGTLLWSLFSWLLYGMS